MDYHSPELRERWRKEASFHDTMAEQDTRWTAFREYGLSASAIQYAKDSVGDLYGKVFLDLGCGDGSHTLSFLHENATVLACDISYQMAKAAKNRLYGPSLKTGCRFASQQMLAEEMAYASGSIDVIFGISVLHHLEISLAIPEIKRVLRQGGHAIFIEPLNHNHLAKLYRLLTPERHTVLEQALDYSIWDLFLQHFKVVRHKEFYLLSLFAAIVAFMKNKVWFDNTFNLLIKIDDELFIKFPYLRKYAWLTVIDLTK